MSIFNLQNGSIFDDLFLVHGTAGFKLQLGRTNSLDNVATTFHWFHFDCPRKFFETTPSPGITIQRISASTLIFTVS